MSSSTRKRRVTDEILESLDDLVQSRPHMRTRAQFGPADLRAYHEGYYWGVTYALRVALEAIDRFQMTDKWRRADARKKRSA